MAQAQQLTPAQLFAINAQARALILQNSVEMIQQIYSASFVPATQNIVNINPRNVGLIKGFLVEVNGNIINSGGGTLTRTEHGMLNAFSNIQFTDLNNIVRINTSGRHIGLLNTVRQGFAYGGAYIPTIPVDLASTWTVQSAPATILTTANSNVRFFYWIPLAYAPDDLRGAVYASVVNATMNLQLTINPTPAAAAGDPVPLIYSGTTGGWNGAVTITVYQVYLDQLPMGKGGPILPPLDLNNIYELKETTLTGMVAATDFPYGYANFRDFLSTFAIYDNNGVLNIGSDVTYWSLTSANFTRMFQYTPEVAALFARAYTMQDLPKGTYYFDFRRRPLNTIQFGNMQLNLNASAVTAGASLIISTEAFAQVAQVPNASSLDAG